MVKFRITSLQSLLLAVLQSLLLAVRFTLKQDWMGIMEDRKEQIEEFSCGTKGLVNSVSLPAKTVGHRSVRFETTYDFVSLNSFLSYLH